MAIETLEQLKAECPEAILKAYADETLTDFNTRLEEMEAQIVESEAARQEAEDTETGTKTEETEEDVVSESQSQFETRLAAVEMRERQLDAREVLRESLAESGITDTGKSLVKGHFVNAAPEDKAKFKEVVDGEIKAVADHEKAIAESVRLPGTPGVISEAGAPAEDIDVRAGIAKASGVKPEEK